MCCLNPTQWRSLRESSIDQVQAQSSRHYSSNLSASLASSLLSSLCGLTKTPVTSFCHISSISPRTAWNQPWYSFPLQPGAPHTRSTAPIRSRGLQSSTKPPAQLGPAPSRRAVLGRTLVPQPVDPPDLQDYLSAIRANGWSHTFVRQGFEWRHDHQRPSLRTVIYDRWQATQPLDTYCPIEFNDRASKAIGNSIRL